MRCEDCLPLIEEYFDGEVEGRAAARMGAHLAACETCAAALDALSFEQEVYARYDRGLEASPDLWSRVSAEIARDARSEISDAPRPFLSRLRGRLAASFGPLALRPALASSLALLLMAAAAGSLWLSRRSEPAPAGVEVAENAPAAVAETTPRVAPVESEGVAPKIGPLRIDVLAGEAPASAEPSREVAREAPAGQRTVTVAHTAAAAEDDLMNLLATPAAPQANPNVVVIRAEERPAADEAASLFVNATAPARGVVAAPASRPLDPAEKQMASHLERTQMLLRSIKNAPESEATPVDVAYEKSLSRRLLAENATLKLDAEVNGDKETREVLERIEPFLLDIANLRDRPSRDEVRSIGERVRKNEIVASLQVY